MLQQWAKKVQWWEHFGEIHKQASLSIIDGSVLSQETFL